MSKTATKAVRAAQKSRGARVAKSGAARAASIQSSPSGMAAATAAARPSGPEWTAPVLALGTTSIPNALLAHHAALGLDAKDFVLLLHLWRRWDTRDGSAHCSVEQLARDSGIKRGGVQRRLKRMQTAGLLEKRPSQTADGEKVRRYAFQGLVQRTADTVAPRKSAVNSPAKPSPQRKATTSGKATPRKAANPKRRTATKSATAAKPGDSRKRATTSKPTTASRRAGASRATAVRKSGRAAAAGYKR